MIQYDLFGEPIQEEKPKEEPIKVIQKQNKPPRQEIKKEVDFDIDNALKYLKEQAYSFWDMRCWKYKTYEGVMVFLKNYEKESLPHLPHGLNEGHGTYLIGKLIENKVPLDTIATNLILNKNITFAKRIVVCWNNSDACPYWKHYKNFSDCNCERRCNKGEIIGDEQLNTML